MSPLNPFAVSNRIEIESSKSPLFSSEIQLKNGSSLKIADPRATRALVALMDMHAVLGGAASHYGGPAAMAELMSATFGISLFVSGKQNKKWTDCFHFVNDAGHCENGLYALRANYGFGGLSLESLRGFRSIDSALTGHGEAHLYPQGVLISNGPLGSGLPQSQGLAMADAMSGLNRLTFCSLSDGGAMEGEAKESLAAIPGFAQKGLIAPFILIINDNNTKLSGRISEQSYSMEGTFRSLDVLGWKTYHLEDGHHLQACASLLEAAIDDATMNPTQPVAIWARTIKGKGHPSSEVSKSGGHGFPIKKVSELTPMLEAIYTGSFVPETFRQWVEDLKEEELRRDEEGRMNRSALSLTTPELIEIFSRPREKIQKGVSRALIKAAESGVPVVSLTADLPGSTGVHEFQKAFPKRTLDFGVAESNMMSAAIGFSLQGYVPIVDTFAQFGASKGILPLIMSGLSRGPMIGFFSHTGYQDAADGASHQAITYIAQTAAIPNVEVYCLSSSEEAEALVSQALTEFCLQREAGKVPKSRLFFLGREEFLKSTGAKDGEYSLERWPMCFKKQAERNLMLLAAGSLLESSLEAADRLVQSGYGCTVHHVSRILPDSLGFLEESLENIHAILTVEDHRVYGGIGSLTCQQLAEVGIQLPIKCMGIKNHFGRSAHKARQLYEWAGVGTENIFETGVKLLRS